MTGAVARSHLAPAAATGGGVSVAGTSRSSLEQVAELRSSLGATDTAQGTLVSLPGDVLFDFDKATIRPDAKATLDKLAQLIRASAPSSVSVRGFTDSKGDDAYNQKLSEARAAAVKAALGGTIAADKLTAVGFGEKQPVAPNAKPDGADDPDGRQKNRRVEVILAKAGG